MIPKKGDLTLVSNWRGICLVNCEWKIFTKIVDNWIRKECAMRKIITGEQIGFIRKRWIHRNILLTQAVFQGGKDRRGAVFLDIKNAYPSVEFKWIENQMERWWGEDGVALCNILLGGDARININNTLGTWFQMERGVKQGDIVAPAI